LDYSGKPRCVKTIDTIGDDQPAHRRLRSPSPECVGARRQRIAFAIAAATLSTLCELSAATQMRPVSIAYTENSSRITCTCALVRPE